MTPYYADNAVTLHHGDMREILPALDIRADCCVTDPPYGETSLAWDRWPEGWPSIVASFTASMWCFGSMRMLMDRHRDFFAAWKLSQDVVWEKHAGSSMRADRFRRVHEYALHWYTGKWGDVHHETPRTGTPGKVTLRERHAKPGGIHRPLTGSTYVIDGTRLTRSVIRARSMNGRAIHPTEKPLEILTPLISYACPPGGVVLDPFAGSGSTAEAARRSGRRAVLVEASEEYCESIARRLSQPALPLDAP